jgi:hypothetical protein
LRLGNKDEGERGSEGVEEDVRMSAAATSKFGCLGEVHSVSWQK